MHLKYFFLFQTQTMSLQQTAVQQSWLSTNLSNIPPSTMASSDARRMSEPCHTMVDRKSPPPRPASVSLSPLKGNITSPELHPNQAVMLDEVGEGEMVENKLVIPDEMVRYLNQVADNQNNTELAANWSEAINNAQIRSPTSFPGVPSPQNTNLLSPSSAMNQILPSPGNISQMLPSPSVNLNQILPSPQTNFNPMISSPVSNVNQMVNSPTHTHLDQIMPSPSANTNQIPADTMSQMVPSPAMNQIMHSPSSHLNQMVPSPSTNINMMMHSPASNLLPSPGGNQMLQALPSPGNYQLMPSPSSTYSIQNPMMSPASNVNQAVASPANMNQMPLRCHSQISSNSQSAQNCNMSINNGMIMHNNQMVPNCYNSRSVNHGNCYNMQHWENNCQNNGMVNPRDHHSMCNRNRDLMGHCRPQNPIVNGYVNSSGPTPVNQCINHNNYETCNQNCYVNCQNRMMKNYNCGTYQTPLGHNGYNNCISNVSDPLPSPAIATPAPTDIISQPQQAQMSRPCTHYVQNCFPTPPYTSQCASNPQNCNNCPNCRKTVYNQSNQCYGTNTNREVQCKDVSQSQASPSNINNGIMTLGMRHDAYQRTLEYVQNCQSWVNGSETSNRNSQPLKCGDKASSNMIINDMTSSLSSLLEENRYLHMRFNS